MSPSGYLGDRTDKREPGANGMALDAEGNLILCQHGERQVGKMLASLDTPKPEFEGLATDYEGKRFNSPNDLVFNSRGQLFFTDPPYGLPGRGKEEVAKDLFALDMNSKFEISPGIKDMELVKKFVDELRG